VIDQTGLTGFYDFPLTFLPDLPPGFDKVNVPLNIFDALPAAAGPEAGGSEKAGGKLRP
jgi:hypothetical protein